MDMNFKPGDNDQNVLEKFGRNLNQEVKNNKVVQSRIKNNGEPNEKQMQFLHKWEQNVLKNVA